MASLADVRIKGKISCQQHINVWPNMMSGHGTNPIFFNNKKKNWTSRTLANPSAPLRLITPYFALPPIPCQGGRHMCITPYLRMIFVEHEAKFSKTKTRFQNSWWNIYFFRDLSFSAYEKIYEKSYFLPTVMETYMCVSRGKKCIFFSEAFAYVLNRQLIGKISLFFSDDILHFFHYICQVDCIFVWK